jgi:hypothetical protein
MKKIITSILMFLSLSLNAQETPIVTHPTFGDDSYVHVPLQFGFPFYGKVFTNSWMHSNGVVSFLDPAVPTNTGLSNAGLWAYCCQGLELVPTNTYLTSQFNYMIAPLWTDLYSLPNSTFRTEGTSTYQKYFWNNIAQYGDSTKLNTFSLEIKPSGFIGVNYTDINITGVVTAGIIGDVDKGEYQQIYHGVGIPGQSLQNWEILTTGDICLVDPLSSTNCPGYADAYKTQQCSINPLYDPSCPGYADAYFNQQCLLDSLYDRNCEGYATAYAIKYLVGLDPAVTTAVNQQLTNTVEIQRNDPANVVSTTGNSTIDSVLAPPSTTSVNSTTSILSPTTNTQPPGPPQNSSPPPQNSPQQQERAAEGKKVDGEVQRAEKKTGGNPENARKEVAAKATEIAKNTARAATLESQAAQQGLLVGLMGYVPGFGAYQDKMVPDINSVAVERQYQKPVVDNRRIMQRLNGANEEKWNEIVNSQYK